jgi:xylose isomerase
MAEVLRVGGFTNGGLNFDAKQRRGSYELLDTVYAYIAGMDTFALGLRAAYKLLEDGRLAKFESDRYKSYKSGIGADISSGKATIESLEKYSLGLGEVKTNTSGRQELLEGIVNNVILSL